MPQALSDPVRLEIVDALATGGEQARGAMPSPVSGSTRSDHFCILRDAGVTVTGRSNQRAGVVRRRRHEQCFPGLLHVVLRAGGREPPATLAHGDGASDEDRRDARAGVGVAGTAPRADRGGSGRRAVQPLARHARGARASARGSSARSGGRSAGRSRSSPTCRGRSCGSASSRSPSCSRAGERGHRRGRGGGTDGELPSRRP